MAVMSPPHHVGNARGLQLPVAGNRLVKLGDPRDFLGREIGEELLVLSVPGAVEAHLHRAEANVVRGADISIPAGSPEGCRQA